MSRKMIKNSIDQYQRARLCFAQTISSCADQSSSIVYLHDMDVIDLILPLLIDSVPSIQHAALATLGKMVCSKHIDMRSSIRERGVINLILNNLANQSKHYKRTALHMLICTVQKDETTATMITDEDLDNIVSCLKDADPDTRTSSALALGGIAKGNEEKADRIVRADALPLLTQILCCSEPSLKHAAAFALTHIAGHNAVLAECVSQCKTIPMLIKALHTEDWGIKADALLCLAAIAEHSPCLATSIAKCASVLAVQYLRTPVAIVQKNAAILLRDICKHNLSLANLVLAAGGVEGLMGLVKTNKGESCLAAITALGYMASQSKQITERIIDKENIQAIQAILKRSDKEELQGAAAWTFGQIGKHSAANVEKLCQENVVSTLLSKITESSYSDSLKSNCSMALMMLIPKCKNTKELEKILLGTSSEELLVPVIRAFAKILPCCSVTRRSFVTSQCLRKTQDIKKTLKTAPYLKIINACFPEEVIQFVSPNYYKQLVNSLDKFIPQTNTNALCSVDDPFITTTGSANSMVKTEDNNTSDTRLHSSQLDVN